jgi:hypothetical protein
VGTGHARAARTRPRADAGPGRAFSLGRVGRTWVRTGHGDRRAAGPDDRTPGVVRVDRGDPRRSPAASGGGRPADREVRRGRPPAFGAGARRMVGWRCSC